MKNKQQNQNKQQNKTNACGNKACGNKACKSKKENNEYGE